MLVGNPLCSACTVWGSRNTSASVKRMVTAPAFDDVAVRLSMRGSAASGRTASARSAEKRSRVLTVWLFYHTTKPLLRRGLLPRSSASLERRTLSSARPRVSTAFAAPGGRGRPPLRDARNQRLHRMRDVGGEILLRMQMLPEMNRADVRAVREQRLFARVARNESDVSKRFDEKAQTAIVDAAENRSDLGVGRRRQRHVERMRLMRFHRLREERLQARARIGDLVHLIERFAIDLFPSPQRGFDQLRQPFEVPVEASLRDAELHG